MHQRSTEVDGDGAGGEQSINTSEVIRAVRTCQNLSGRDGTCLGLLLLHVGPNGDGFGGQAFIKHYTNTSTITQGCQYTGSKGHC
jgi:hypothetical protein